MDDNEEFYLRLISYPIIIVGIFLVIFLMGCEKKTQINAEPAPMEVGKCYHYSQNAVHCLIGDQSCYIYWGRLGPEVVCTGPIGK